MSWKSAKLPVPWTSSQNAKIDLRGCQTCMCGPWRRFLGRRQGSYAWSTVAELLHSNRSVEGGKREVPLHRDEAPGKSSTAEKNISIRAITRRQVAHQKCATSAESLYRLEHLLLSPNELLQLRLSTLRTVSKSCDALRGARQTCTGVAASYLMRGTAPPRVCGPTVHSSQCGAQTRCFRSRSPATRFVLPSSEFVLGLLDHIVLRKGSNPVVSLRRSASHDIPEALASLVQQPWQVSGSHAPWRSREPADGHQDALSLHGVELLWSLFVFYCFPRASKKRVHKSPFDPVFCFDEFRNRVSQYGAPTVISGVCR